MKTNTSISTVQGFRLGSILIHSLWITAVGAVLFRLATANTQKQLIYAQIFAISGTVLATTPWVVQLIVSTAIIVLYNAGVRDFTWIVRPEESTEGPRAEIDGDIERGRLWVANGSQRWLVMRKEGNKEVRFNIEDVNGPKLQRNRTI
ncbi:hypothetical protein ACSBR2_002580 [Camellia fascicularis]